jgi:hypothetical protein
MLLLPCSLRIPSRQQFLAVLVLFAQTVTAAGLPVSASVQSCGCDHAGGQLGNCCCGPAGCSIPKPAPKPSARPPKSCCSAEVDEQAAECGSCGTSGPSCCCSEHPRAQPQPPLPFVPNLTADDCRGRPFSPPGWLTTEPGLPPICQKSVPYEPACSHITRPHSVAATPHRSRPPVPPPRSI